METMQGPFGQQAVQNKTRPPRFVCWIAVKTNSKNNNRKKGKQTTERYKQEKLSKK